MPVFLVSEFFFGFSRYAHNLSHIGASAGRTTNSTLGLRAIRLGPRQLKVA